MRSWQRHANCGLPSMSSKIRYHFFLGMAAMAMILFSANPSESTTTPEYGKKSYNNTICRNVTRNTEREIKLPTGVLSAISLVESGRRPKNAPARIAWPWTVTAEGRGRYLPSKAAAIAEVKELRKRGIKNIDVGCMQVNLYYHGKAFASISDAFTPVSNARYAGKFLKELHQETKSWSKVVSYYHSRTKHLATAYHKRVMKAWDEVRQLANLENSRNNANRRIKFNKNWRTVRRATRLHGKFRTSSSQRWRKYKRR